MGVWYDFWYMKKFFKAGTLCGVFLFALVVLPGITSAAHIESHGGLVPCGGAGQPECGTCDFMKLGNNILQFFVQFAIIIAGLMFAWGGLTMVMSAGESGKVTEAKGMMTSSIIGILIVLSGWLLVDTLLKMVLKGGETGQIYGMWQEIQCSKPGEPTATPGTPTTGGGGGGTPTTGGGTSSTDDTVSFEDGKYTLPNGQSETTLQANYSNVESKYASQIASACEGSDIPDCSQVVAALIARESLGGDPTLNSSEGAFGLMQLLSKNGGQTCSETNMTCIEDQINKGVDMLNDLYGSSVVGNSIPNMLAAYNGGGSVAFGSSPSGKNPPLANSIDCPGLFAYQCEIDPGGLLETQEYVADICKTLILNGSDC